MRNATQRQSKNTRHTKTCKYDQESKNTKANEETQTNKHTNKQTTHRLSQSILRWCSRTILRLVLGMQTRLSNIALARYTRITSRVDASVGRANIWATEAHHTYVAAQCLPSAYKSSTHSRVTEVSRRWLLISSRLISSRLLCSIAIGEAMLAQRIACDPSLTGFEVISAPRRCPSGSVGVHLAPAGLRSPLRSVLYAAAQIEFDAARCLSRRA